MSRRKCCCPCEQTCVPKRDQGKALTDSFILEIPESLVDKSYCYGVTPDRTCEDQITGDYTLPYLISLPSGDSWGKLDYIENCHCVESDFIEKIMSITEECVDISSGYEPEKLVCIVTVTIVALESNACSYDVPDGASQRWIYKVAGPIDVRNGNSFEVPFFSEEIGYENNGPESVCEPMTYPDSVFIKETP